MIGIFLLILTSGGMIIMSTISENIRKFRIIRQMTQRDLAAHLNVTVATVANWERGNDKFSVHTLLELCKVLDATPNQICGFDESNEINSFYNFLENCDDNETKTFKRMMRYLSFFKDQEQQKQDKFLEEPDEM